MILHSTERLNGYFNRVDAYVGPCSAARIISKF